MNESIQSIEMSFPLCEFSLVFVEVQGRGTPKPASKTGGVRVQLERHRRLTAHHQYHLVEYFPTASPLAQEDWAVHGPT